MITHAPTGATLEAVSTARRRRGLLAALLVAVLVAMLLPPTTEAEASSGATFTTTNISYYSGNQKTPARCVHGPNGNKDSVNCNLYNAKEYVWLNGGPVGAMLGAGDYYFVVLEPGGQPDPNDGTAKNLHWGKEDHTTRAERTFTVDDGGTIVSGPSGHVLNNNRIRLFPYADTGNPGGVYILAVCRADSDPTSPRECKYDAFKVREGRDEEPPPPLSVISGMKYYDANANGRWDPGEPGLEGWPIDFTNGSSGSIYTDATGAFAIGPLLAGDSYTFAEQQAQYPWVQTGNTVNQSAASGTSNATLNADMTYTVTLGDGDVSGLNFGNVCVVPFDGRTPGFWQNPNGRELIDGDDLQALRDLHLVWPDGSAFDPTHPDDMIPFNSDSNGENMASQLSRHLAALLLNVRNGFVDGDAVVFGDGRTVNELIADADSALAAAPITLNGHPARAAQQALKDLIASINESLATSVPSSPAGCPTPEFGTP